jgi:hypothetical protein
MDSVYTPKEEERRTIFILHLVNHWITVANVHDQQMLSTDAQCGYYMTVY